MGRGLRPWDGEMEEKGKRKESNADRPETLIKLVLQFSLLVLRPTVTIVVGGGGIVAGKCTIAH